MNAIIKTMEMAAPKPKYVTIRQGIKGPFLQFVEKIAAVVQNQVDDENLRQILCKQLASDNANDNCQKFIETLPGDISVPEMVMTCSKIGTV